MKDFSQKYSVNGKTFELLNRFSDPAMWIVNVYKKFLIFNKKESSYWFNDKEEAETFYNSMKSK